jgi:hypothetical protein
MDAKTTPIRYDDFNFSRTPDVRWQRANHLARSGLSVASHDEPETLAALEYLRAAADCRSDADRTQLDRRWPGIAAAVRLYAVDGPGRWAVEARIVAGQSDEQIAALCSLSPETVQWYEALFWRIRDRLSARDWIAARVIGLRSGFTREQMGRLWCAYAYSAGPIVLGLVIAVTLDHPLPSYCRPRAGEDPRLYEVRLRLKTKLAVASMMMCTEADVEAVRKLYRAQLRLEKAVSGTSSGRDPRVEATLKVLAISVRDQPATTGTGTQQAAVNGGCKRRAKPKSKQTIVSSSSLMSDLMMSLAGSPSGGI